MTQETSYQYRFCNSLSEAQAFGPPDLLAAERMKARESLERDVASLIGHMLIELSRLDLNLGLCLAWADGVANLESRSKQVEEMNLKARLDELRKLVDTKYPLKPKVRQPSDAWYDWIDNVDTVRETRNEFVHSRWDLQSTDNKATTINGMPSGEQTVTEHTVEGMALLCDEICFLQRRLSKLRKDWPL
jgi:hypothetical protein